MPLIKSQLFSELVVRHVACYVHQCALCLHKPPTRRRRRRRAAAAVLLLLLLLKTMIMVMRYHDNSIVLQWRMYDAWYVWSEAFTFTLTTCA